MLSLLSTILQFSSKKIARCTRGAAKEDSGDGSEDFGASAADEEWAMDRQPAGAKEPAHGGEHLDSTNFQPPAQQALPGREDGSHLQGLQCTIMC